MTQSFITPGHVWAFQAVTTLAFGQPQLLNCLIDGKPGVAIVLMRQLDDDRVEVMPLFVAITESMSIEFVGQHGERDGGGGGPRRSFRNAQRQATATAPSPKVA